MMVIVVFSNSLYKNQITLITFFLSLAPDEKSRAKANRGAIEGTGESMVLTKPSHIQSKQGETGARIMVRSNYFALNSAIKWQIFHYHVEFVPEIENVAFRNSLLVNQVPQLGGFLYDRGSSIYTITQLHNERLEVSTRDRDGNDILIRIQRVGLISTLEHRFIQVINLIMKKALKALNLQLVGRDYFDAAARVNIKLNSCKKKVLLEKIDFTCTIYLFNQILVPEHGIELWPGYTTSIRQHESSLLLMAEIKHKLMRTGTLLDILKRCYQESRNNWQQNFMQEVLGMIVLTRYNNKTYRISDVIFDLNPSSTFETKDGPISYVDYYRVSK